MLEIFKRKFMEYFCRDTLIARDIEETLKLPVRGTVSHTLNIYIGIHEEEIRKMLEGCILREHKNPFEGIDIVISANAWPEISRFFISGEKLIAAIIEIGVYHKHFEKVFRKVENRISELFAHSIEGHTENSMKFPIYMWEYSKHYCYFQVVSDKIANINPLFLDYDYFGRELDGTFIGKPGSRFACLPTLAVVFSKDQKSRALSMLYLQKDLEKRGEACSLLNLPFIGGKR